MINPDCYFTSADNSVGNNLDKIFSHDSDEKSQEESNTPTDTSKMCLESEIISSPKKQEESHKSPYRVGIVVSYHARKGFGILQDINSRTKYFVHYTALVTTKPPLFAGWKACLYTGETVSFQVGQNPSHPSKVCALNVTGIRNNEGVPCELMCDKVSWRAIVYR
tara:strand:- start:8606 stop:9100 length:495 start_codon:yes stop_codon:yes gene_type:complete